jgi:ABC-type Fe3+-hydroxamate transport system substrate-binding protein
MRLLAVIALVLVSSVASASSAAPTEAARHATLTIKSVMPLRVAGSGFKPNELVRLAVESRPKTVRADSHGRFYTGLPPVDPCNGFIVTAKGGKGSNASIAFNATWRVYCIAP